MFQKFKVPCLETIDQLKLKCKKLGIKIVPYNCEKNCLELSAKHKRENELDENEDSRKKRQKTYSKLNNKRPLNDKIEQKNAFLTENGVTKHESNNLKPKNGLVENHDSQNDRVCDYYYKNLNNPEKIKLIIQSLDNLNNLEKLLDFYNQLNRYAKSLNEILVKYNNKPIIVRNRVDQELPPSFHYMDEYKLDQLDARTLKLISDDIRKCDCKHQCNSFSKTVKLTCCSSLNDDNCYYNSLGTIKNSIKKRGPIIECTKRCACNETCPNKVIQKGTQVDLEIFKTNDGRGWGLKTLQKIPKGTFICTYRGEVVTSEEASKRQADPPFKDRYFFNLDYNEELEFEYVVDATNTASLGRFLNHSCYPNCETFIAYIENFFSKIPVIAFFTNRLIKEGEELTIDYFMGNDCDQANLDGKIGCLCKSSDCKKYYF